MKNKLAPYWKAAVAFVAPGAALLILDAATGSIGSTDLVVAALTCITTSAAVYAAPKNKPAA
jgi:hypothetical protein